MKYSSRVVLWLACFFFNNIACRKHGRHLIHQNANIDDKIVGGYNASIQDAPYQVYLLIQIGDEYYQCGGSIIKKTYVLTAAHCLTGAVKIFIRAGSNNSETGGTQYTTTRYTQHPLYNRANHDYDVGVINIPNGIALDGVNTRAVGLPNKGTALDIGTNALVTGWGTTSENGHVSKNLMAVEVPITSQSECLRSYPKVTKRQFCAGVPEGGKDSCQGDSGGPAVSSKSGLQVGIVSFGVGCARKGFPGVYTNVANVRSFIRIRTGV